MSFIVRVLVPASLVLICACKSVPAQDTALVVAEVVVAAGMDTAKRQPVDPAESFPAGIPKVFCFTRIRDAKLPTTITHVWYYEGATMARVELPVRSVDWRTWSSKKIMPGWQGRWQVKILDEEGLVMDSLSFNIVAPAESPLVITDPEGAEQ